MQTKIHHFVHLGYTPENHSEYQEKILGRLEEIVERVKKGASDIIVMVKDGENIEESLIEMNMYKLLEYIAIVISFYNVQLRNPSIYILEKLLKFVPEQIIFEVINELKKHKEILGNDLIYDKKMKKWLLTNPSSDEILERFTKDFLNQKRSGEKEFIDNYVMNLYYDIMRKMLEKYEKKNIFKAQLGLERNKEFRNKVSSILSGIPVHKVLNINMRGQDTAYGILGLNAVYYSQQKQLGEYYEKMKDFVAIKIGILKQKRLKKEFAKLELGLKNNGIDPKNGCEHILAGEYSDACVTNYSHFLEHYLNIEKGKIKIDKDISLHSSSRKEEKKDNNIFYIK